MGELKRLCGRILLGSITGIPILESLLNVLTGRINADRFVSLH